MHTKNQPRGECDNVKIKDKVGGNSYIVSVEKYFDCSVHGKKRLVSPFSEAFMSKKFFIYLHTNLFCKPVHQSKRFCWKVCDCFSLNLKDTVLHSKNSFPFLL